MLNMSSFKKSHDSVIPRITLWSFAERSLRLNQALSRYDKHNHQSKLYSYSPTFKRNWTISPTKNKEKHPSRIKKLIQKENSESGDWSAVDQYISKVLEEFKLKEVEDTEKHLYIKKPNGENAFDRYLGMNGAEEERQLLEYLRNCDMYEK